MITTERSAHCQKRCTMSVRAAESEPEPALALALAPPPTLAPTAMSASRLHFVLSVGRNERLRHEEASTAACELKETWFAGSDYITGLPGAIGHVKIERYAEPHDNSYKITSLFENIPKRYCPEDKCNHDFEVTEVTCTKKANTARYEFEVYDFKTQKNSKPVVTVDLTKKCGDKKAYQPDKDDYSEQLQQVLRGIAMFITKKSAVSEATKVGRKMTKFVTGMAEKVMSKK